MRKITSLKNSGFFEKIYEIVFMIPTGKVVTYGQIARKLGNPRAARQVGYAMASAPSNYQLPCHRVVNRRGELAHHMVFGDQSFQRAMLENEGVTFLTDGRVNLEKHLWDVDILSVYSDEI